MWGTCLPKEFQEHLKWTALRDRRMRWEMGTHCTTSKTLFEGGEAGTQLLAGSGLPLRVCGDRKPEPGAEPRIRPRDAGRGGRHSKWQFHHGAICVPPPCCTMSLPVVSSLSIMAVDAC